MPQGAPVRPGQAGGSLGPRRRFLGFATGAATAAALGTVGGCANDGGAGQRPGSGRASPPAGPDDKTPARGARGVGVKAENSRPGHAHLAVTKAGPARAIEGYPIAPTRLSVSAPRRPAA
ncbi:hypothetical protein SSAG_01149 [Streptomyces sp. Mg1]|nr:hypothetical protein SSAG_01149 [Streptomyces sp. Mg1]